MSERDDCDGGTFGDLAFTLSAIDHWFFEGRPWTEVPEFDAGYVAKYREDT